MNYFTTDLYETKREILKVSKKVSSGLDKPKAKFLSDMIDDSKNYFVIRMQDRRNFFFKGKKKNCHQIAITRKGKIKINVWFEDEEKECYISHTKVTMPFN
ncbi:MAG: hypothetical protein IKJ43_04895, partial [Bacilli bacterium]|nr:hypothetical protein [Bacilli bacterium]